MPKNEDYKKIRDKPKKSNDTDNLRIAAHWTIRTYGTGIEMHLEMQGANLSGSFRFGYGVWTLRAYQARDQVSDPARPLSSPPRIPFLYVEKFISSSVLKFQISSF